MGETAWCLIGYIIGLVPIGWVLILSPGCNARGFYKGPAIASTISMALNIMLNAFLFFTLDWVHSASR